MLDYRDFIDTTKFYSPEKVLKVSENTNIKIFHIISNRTSGKTTSMQIYSFCDYINTSAQFLYLVRNKKELNNFEHCFDDLLKIYPDTFNFDLDGCYILDSTGYQIYDKKTKKILGFVVSLKSADDIKKFRGLFNNVNTIIFEEFLTETGKYLKNEYMLLQSIYTTVASGNGKHVRDVKMFLLGNNVSMINPYYSRYNVVARKQENTRFIRYDTAIFEFYNNECASKELLEKNPFMTENDKYSMYATLNKSMTNDNCFIAKYKNNGIYYASIIFDNAIIDLYFCNSKIYFVNNTNIKNNSRRLYASSNNLMNNGTILLYHSDLINHIKRLYYKSLLRFDSIQTKELIYNCLSINLFE